LYRPNISDSRLINNEGAAFALPHCAGADPVWGFDPAWSSLNSMPRVSGILEKERPTLAQISAALATVTREFKGKGRGQQWGLSSILFVGI
jgi:hypothetical protein